MQEEKMDATRCMGVGSGCIAKNAVVEAGLPAGADMQPAQKPDKHAGVRRALEALREGKLIVVLDDKDRENEGDLVCAAECVNAEHINFMAKEARGLICTPMSAAEATRLCIGPMVEHNTDTHETAFTVSVDYKDVSTGISAAERALTARKLAEKTSQPLDFRRPGHMFPLVAKEGGVLLRPGHTEATVDLCRLAGLRPCGLCCEIMRDDGTMMREAELRAFASKHGLELISIKELQEYRKCHDKMVDCVASPLIPTRYGSFRAYTYVSRLTGEHHIALVKGDIAEGENILCRVHSECLTGDAFGSLRCDCGEQLAKAMEMIEAEGRGVLLYMRQEGRGIGLVNKMRAYELQEKGMDTLDANLALGLPADAREYYLGAQILSDLGVRSLRLLTNNPDKVYQLDGFGLTIAERVPLELEAHEHDEAYLKTKQIRMGHYLTVV